MSNSPVTVYQRRTAVIALSLGMSATIVVAVLWLAALFDASSLGIIAYLAPLSLPGGVAATYGIFCLLRGNDRAVRWLLFLSMVILLINFRERDPGQEGLDPQSALKVIFWAIMLIAAIPHLREIRRLLSSNLTCRFALGFCAFSLLSVFWSAEPGVTAASGIGLFAAFAFSSVLALRVTPIVVSRTFFYAMAILILIACASYFIAPSVALMPPSEGESNYRLQGLAGHPNLLGQEAAVLLLMAVAMWEGRAVSRLWILLIGLAGAAAIVFSESRTSLVAVMVAVGVVRLRQIGLVRPIFAVALAISSVFIFLSATDWMPDIAHYFGAFSRSGSTSELTTFTGRTELWQISWERFLEKPWLGWGYNANERLMMDSVGPNFAGNPVNSHNMLMQALMTMGLVGTSMVLGMIGGMAHNMIVRPNAMRDRIFVYLMVLGIAEAEFLTLPVVAVYLSFWAVADAAVEALNETTSLPVPQA